MLLIITVQKKFADWWIFLTDLSQYIDIPIKNVNRFCRKTTCKTLYERNQLTEKGVAEIYSNELVTESDNCKLLDFLLFVLMYFNTLK